MVSIPTTRKVFIKARSSFICSISPNVGTLSVESDAKKFCFWYFTLWHLFRFETLELGKKICKHVRRQSVCMGEIAIHLVHDIV